MAGPLRDRIPAALLARMRRGERDAFERTALACTLALRICGDRAEADDVLQETC
jgi:DNA-directed RNA polymerase specialized sigma24 family protein